jgi:amino acid transporter
MSARLQREEGSGPLAILKRIVLGRAMSSDKLEHTLLPKLLALPVFSSDPLSSVAYATEEMMLVLALAGAAAFSFMLPIALVISAVLAIVITSYRQTVRAYPRGGGSYIVARENLGKFPGLIAAAAILSDYVLTVAVSTTAGTLAITSAAPGLAHLRVPIALGLMGLVMLANLRGSKEAGALFAIPTYGFVACVYITLVAGFANCLNGCPQAASASLPLHPEQAVTLFLLARAFASGSTALTGVEAIADGVQAFRRPQAKNAAATLGIMGVMSISMFIGITYLARAFNVHVSEALVGQKSVLAQVGATVFGDGTAMFYVLQVFTALILVLAANTAYQDFPRLSAILARDRFVPSQFRNRGDRLVYSNGVVVLSVIAGLLIWHYDAQLTRLIQLYVIGVFTAFTLSQAGMVRRWIRMGRTEAPKGWRRSLAINAVGAMATGIVLVVVILTKFSKGGYVVMSGMVVLVGLMLAVERHYGRVGRQLRRGAVIPGEPAGNTVVLMVTDFDSATAEALGYLRSLRPDASRYAFLPVHGVPGDLQDRWHALAGPAAPDLEVVPLKGTHPGKSVRDYLRGIERGPKDFLTLVLPEMVRTRSVFYLLRRTPQTRIKFRLLSEPGVVLTNVTVQEVEGRAVEVDSRPLIPARIETLVFVSSIHDATIRAVNYAVALRAPETRAVYFATDPDEIEKIEEGWARSGLTIPLDIVEAPFRDLSEPVLREVRRVTADPDALCVVVLPEFVLRTWWHGLLHNNTALFIKRQLLFEPRVVLTSVPYHLE